MVASVVLLLLRVPLQTLADIKALLAAHGLSPRKALGQNFLIDKNLIAKLLDAAGVGPGDVVMEVGPGTGTLTDALLERGCIVVACELDAGLAGLLRARLGGEPRFALVEGDCLAAGRAVNPALMAEVHAALARAGRRRWSLVANLPYQAATPLMLSILMHHRECDRMAVTIQREVAQRLAATPDTPTSAGERHYGLLSVVAQSLASVQRVAMLPPECFWPRPDVTSAMVLLQRLETPLTDDPTGLAAFCQLLFSRRRKQLGAILGRDFPFPPGVAPTLRPENLAPAALVQLAAAAKAASLTLPPIDPSTPPVP